MHAFSQLKDTFLKILAIDICEIWDNSLALIKGMGNVNYVYEVFFPNFPTFILRNKASVD